MKKVFVLMVLVIAIIFGFTACPTDGDDSSGWGKSAGFLGKTPKITGTYIVMNKLSTSVTPLAAAPCLASFFTFVVDG